MKAELKGIEAGAWTCGRCGKALERLPVDIVYMGSSFQVDLPRCPDCAFTYIPPELAEGKMLEVEHILEDK
ncbi:DNA-binding protein [Desulfovibrio sp. OttesenSCG-928-G11]|nr:DNA-binding protein [Desulfovibrio sp. OttesenSCG-928-G11]